ncbi:MAG: hypothetical protein IJQ83_03055 [Bacteroidales bacterium]|nr:hypothetical protein [Bacteroidales bacterium]
MNIEDIYRRMAVSFIKEMGKTRTLFKGHLPSIGYVGEQLLRQALKRVLPNDFDICQGFVLNETDKGDKMSKQCDIIIYHKGNKAVVYSVGELKVINASYAVAVIEVKSSIIKESFFTTLKAFEMLIELGVRNKFIFVFGSVSKQSLSNWFFQYKYPESNINEWMVMDTELYDWLDKEQLPNSILSLESCKYYVLEHLQDEKNDWVGYASYKITDSKNMEISCLQEFFASVMEMLNGKFYVDQNDYSIKDGFPMWKM